MSARRSFSGSRLRDLRRDAHTSRTVLAFAVGRTVDSISNYERGLTTPSADVLARLADFLGCSPDEFFELEAIDV
jgi:transcriptional regulator with XRE-family HTH domain